LSAPLAIARWFFPWPSPVAVIWHWRYAALALAFPAVVAVGEPLVVRDVLCDEAFAESGHSECCTDFMIPDVKKVCYCYHAVD
jgi:hypothetical protein